MGKRKRGQKMPTQQLLTSSMLIFSGSGAVGTPGMEPGAFWCWAFGGEPVMKALAAAWAGRCRGMTADGCRPGLGDGRGTARKRGSGLQAEAFSDKFESYVTAVATQLSTS